jgi:hypothetical protein
MAAIDIVVVLCAIFICGFPGLTNYILTNSDSPEGASAGKDSDRSALVAIL